MLPITHFKVTSWQILLTVCNCLVLLCKTCYRSCISFQLQIFPPSPLPHGSHPLSCNSQSSAPWAHHTLSSTKTTLSSGTSWYGQILLFWFKPPLLKQAPFWLSLSIRFSKDRWTGWIESQKGPQSWSERWENCHMRKVLGNWACLDLRKTDLWDISSKNVSKEDGGPLFTRHYMGKMRGNGYKLLIRF